MSDNEETLQLLAKALFVEATSIHATMQRNGLDIKTTDFLLAKVSKLLDHHGLTDDPVVSKEVNLSTIADIVNNDLGKNSTFEVVFEVQYRAPEDRTSVPAPCYTGRYRHPIPS